MYSNPQPTFPGYSNPAAADYGTPKPPVPHGHAGWAVSAIVFFWPVAFAAANWSSKVYPLWAQGDFVGAQHASDRAKKLGKIALVVCIVFTVLIFGLYTALIAAAVSSVNDSTSYGH